jgi:hypothetical protein
MTEPTTHTRRAPLTAVLAILPLAALLLTTGPLAACTTRAGGTGATRSASAPTTSAGASSATPSPPMSSDSTASLQVPTPTPNPADFVRGVDNPFLPLPPGTRWEYDVTSSDGREIDIVEVTRQAKVVAGVTTVVVRDTVRDAHGAVLEDTFDWYAQDRAGNVWYFGEATKAYEGGSVNTEGSWEAGVKGAQAGIIMLAHPQPGDTYQQEYLRKVAEDRARVLAVDARATVPFGTFTGVVQTADSTPLEPAILEHKFYARGVGVVLERDVRGGDEVVRLVRMTTG